MAVLSLCIFGILLFDKVCHFIELVIVSYLGGKDEVHVSMLSFSFFYHMLTNAPKKLLKITYLTYILVLLDLVVWHHESRFVYMWIFPLFARFSVLFCMFFMFIFVCTYVCCMLNVNRKAIFTWLPVFF